MRYPHNGFLRLNRFSLKNGTFDFGTTIGCVNNTSTFVAVLTNINLVKQTESIFLNSTILMRTLLFSQLNRECFILGYFAFCLAVFMPGPRNMHPARGVSSYKYPNSYDKVVSSGPTI